MTGPAEKTRPKALAALTRREMLFSLFFLTGLYGCASTTWQRTLAAWKGHKLDDMLVAWGAPDSLIRLDDGRRVATFGHSRLVDGTQYFCRITVSTDASGVIVATRYDGNIGGCNYFFRTRGAPN